MNLSHITPIHLTIFIIGCVFCLALIGLLISAIYKSYSCAVIFFRIISNGCPYPVRSKYRYGDEHPDKPGYYCIGHKNNGEEIWAPPSISSSENNISIGFATLHQITNAENNIMIGKWAADEDSDYINKQSHRCTGFDESGKAIWSHINEDKPKIGHKNNGEPL